AVNGLNDRVIGFEGMVEEAPLIGAEDASDDRDSDNKDDPKNSAPPIAHDVRHGCHCVLLLTTLYGLNELDGHFSKWFCERQARDFQKKRDGLRTKDEQAIGAMPPVRIVGDPKIDHSHLEHPQNIWQIMCQILRDANAAVVQDFSKPRDIHLAD